MGIEVNLNIRIFIPIEFMVHDLEKKLNAPAKDILDAISRGMRAQVDVKGKLAELYLYRILKKLEARGKISGLEWLDKDGEPDFRLICKSRKIRIECKNLRNEVFSKPERTYKAEIQKTRNSKDGSNTRSYRKDHLMFWRHANLTRQENGSSFS